MSYKPQITMISFLLAGSVAFGGTYCPVYAGETGTVFSTETESAADKDSAGESESRVLLPSAGFAYSFSAKKVSLRDVEDQLYDSGEISEKKTEETSLTPVQKQEQAVVNAVSQTQGIEINNATATILSATAVTVVSEPSTAVSLAKLADKKQTQAKLDQGVITAGEAEALMATTQASTSISVQIGGNSSDESSSGPTEVVISIAPGTGEGESVNPADAPEVSLLGTAGDSSDGQKEDAADAQSTGTSMMDEDSAAEAGTDSSEAAQEADTSSASDATSAETSEQESTEAADAVTTAANEAQSSSNAGSTAVTEQAETAEDAESGSTENAASEVTESTGLSEQNSAGAVATDSHGNELVVAQVNDYINIRENPDQESEIEGKLYNGSVAKVLGRTGSGWARISSGDVTGYIREEYVATGETAQQLADSVSTKQAVVTTETLRVRAAAQADSDVITLIGQGETLDILGEENGWYKISTPDGEGYISSDFADVEEVYPEAISRQQEEAEEAARKAEEEAEEAQRKAAESAAASSESTTEEKSSQADSASSQTDDTASSSSSTDSGSSLNTYSGTSSAGTSAGQAVVNYALQFLGNPYVWGGSSLTNGTDCSGFTMAVYANFGYSLPHYTGSQESCGTAVASLADAQPGDLILYDGHVGIYMGNNQIVHASNPRTGITTGTATYRHIVAIRRIIN